MATEERRIQFVTEVDNTGARAGFDDLSQQAGQMANSVAASGQRAERAVNDIGNGAGASASKVEAAQRNLIGSIQRTTAQMEAGSRSSSKYFETLASQRGVDPQVLEPYLAQLRAVELAQQRARTAALGGASGIDDLGISAGQTRAALQQLPAQITDVVTSLQGGQAPLTVLIQQGGQIADAFGGIQPALQHVGQHLMRFITPINIVAVGVGLLALAYKSGAKEADAYARAIAQSGNAIGATSDQMSEAARRVADVAGSQSDAAEALVGLAGASQVSSENMGRFALVAVEGQRVLGRSIADTVSEFDALGSAPLATLESLNDKYHFLTAEVYAQVKALQDQGRAAEAATAAQTAYADGMEKQRYKVLDALSDWERGWMRIKKWTSEAVDAIPGIGREATDFEKINSLLAQREALETRVQRLREAGQRRDGAGYDESKDRDLAGARASLDVNQRSINAIRARGDADKAAAKEAADAAQVAEARIKWDREAEKYLDKSMRLKREETRIRNEGNAAGVSEEEIIRRIAAARKAALQGDWDAAAKKREDAMRAEAAALAEISGLTTTFAADWKMLSDLYVAGKISLEQLTKQQADLLANQPAMKAAAEQEIADRKLMTAAAEEYSKAYDVAAGTRNKAASDLEGQLRENEQIGLGAVALAELNAVRLESMALRAEEKVWMAEGLDITGQLAGRYREEADALRARAQAMREGAAAEAAFESNKRALDELNRSLDPGRAETFGEALREAFGTAGDSISRLTSSLDSFGRKQAKIAEDRAAAEKLRGTKDFDEIKYQRTIAELNERDTKNRLAGYGAMTGAAAGFFGEQSRGYKALQTASQVFHAAELAMTLAELVPKGIAAVLTQGTGDPYTAFGRMAAMAAIVAGLGVAIGGVSGGGVPLSQQRQEKQGTGTVLGSDAKSESIARALDAIEGATLQGLGISNGMLISLRNIEAGIGQFASLLVRTTGVTGSFGADLAGGGFDKKGINSLGAIGGGLAGGLAGGAVAGAMTMGVTGATSLTALGAVAGPIGMAVGAVLGAVLGKTLGKVTTAIFGGKKTVEDTGFTVRPISFQGIQDGRTDAMQYADIKTSGGWFGKDKSSVALEGLGLEGNRQIANVLMSLYDTVFEAGTMLDIGAEGFAAQLNSFVVDIGKVSLKGLSDDEIQKELSAVFSKVGDELAKFGVGGLEQFQKVGEGYLETLARVATNYQAVEVVTDSLGMTFNSMGLASVGARERLIDLVGGLDEFTSSADQFLSDFYTDQERANSLRARIMPTLDQYGIKTGADDSLEQFRSVVTGLDLTTEAGARAYATLMQIAPAFKLIADVDGAMLEQRRDLEIEVMELLGNKSGALAASRAAELAGLDASLRPLQQRVYALQDEAAALETANSLLSLQAQIYELNGDKASAAAVLAQQQAIALAELDPALRGATLQLWGLQAAAKATEQVKTDAAALMGGVDGAFSVLQKVVERQKKALQEEINVRTKSIQKIEALSQSLRSTLDGMTVQGREAEDRQAAQAQIQAALTIAKASGKLPDADDLRNALSIVSRDSAALFATQEDYLRDFYATRNGIEDLSGLSDKALTVEERSLKKLEDQVKQYDLMLEREQEQIDVLKGISVTGLSIEQALAALHGAILSAQANPVNSATSAISDAYKSALGRAPDKGGLDFWTDKAAGGLGTGAIVDAIKNSPEAKIRELYRDVFGRAPDAGGLQFWLKQMNGGMSLATIRDAMMGSDEKKLRGFAVGANYIPVDMPAMVHQGERIIPAADNRELMRRLASPEQGNEVLAAAVDRLTQTVARQEQIIANLQAAADGTQRNTKRLADGMEIVTDGYNAVRTKEEVPA